jgi:hypothetical protein
MPLLTKLKNFFVLFLQRCYAYGVKGSDTIVLELASERSLFRRVIYAAGQPRSGDIPVENRAQQNLQPRQGRHIPHENAKTDSTVRPHNYAAGQPRRGEIFVENRTQQNFQPQTGLAGTDLWQSSGGVDATFGLSNVIEFKDVTGVIFHAKFFQEGDIF